MLIDKYNRVHNYLRISLTDNCNLRCFYCMPEEEYEFTKQANLMQADEIESLAKTFVQLGVNKIRLTGGEPLVRKDAADIILRLAKLPVKLTLTTNGTRLHEFVDVLEEAGVRSLNISLDTLQAATFQHLTRRDQFQQVYNNIQLLINRNFHVKVNVVVMKGLNDGEINDFIAWTKDTPVHVRFIEFMPACRETWDAEHLLPAAEILFSPIDEIIAEIAAGRIVIVVDVSIGGDARIRGPRFGEVPRGPVRRGTVDVVQPLLPRPPPDHRVVHLERRRRAQAAQCLRRPDRPGSRRRQGGAGRPEGARSPSAGWCPGLRSQWRLR